MIGKPFLHVAVLFFIFCFVSLDFANAQDFNVKDLNKVDIESLSDSQIQSVINQLDERGVSDNDLELIAKSRGVSDSQIRLLRKRISQVRAGLKNVNTSSQNADETEGRLRNEAPVEQPPVMDQNDLDVDESIFEAFPEERIFGIDLFRSKNLTFEPSVNIPTPKNYQLGAGDELIIDIWGASEQTYQALISPEGSIRIPNIGPIYISGYTVQDASKKIRSRLKRIYSGLGNNIYADISLGKVKSIRVNMVGEVENQGSYLISSFSTVFNALYLTGGPTENGSLRNIDVFRNDKKIATVDVYEYLFNGKNVNLTLQEGDLIIVRPFERRVQIVNKVKRPGYYEMLKDEPLSKLIKYAGGFSNEAYREAVSVIRNKDLKKSFKTVKEESFDTFLMQPGDVITVSEILDLFVNRVQIVGAVNKPGEFELEEGMMLSDLIRRAEGLKEDAFYERGSITRRKNDLTLTLVPFDVAKVISGEQDWKLENEDIVGVKSIFNLKNELIVEIDGEVREPGEYSFVDSMTVEDLVLRANGFKSSAVRSTVEVARRKAYDDASNPTTTSEIFNFQISDDLSMSDEASDFILEPFDLVLIRKSPHYQEQPIVEIQGEVNLPGFYVLEKKDERISDLLKKAGGITGYGYVKGATLVRVTEFFDEDQFEADRLRRENLEELSSDTTVTFNANFKRSESIGINLEEIIKSPGSKYDLILKQGDVIGIPKQLQTVRLRGELLYPSTVRYDGNNTFKDYVSQAGGYSGRAKRSQAYILYANGTVERTKHFLWFKNYPKVEPGAEVIIPSKPEKRKLLPGEIIGIASGLGTIALIINNLTN